MAGKERIYLFDTTLRDGAQTQAVDFNAEDKRQIAAALNDLGVDYIEGGWPGANPTDTDFFANPGNIDKATFTAFGMTKRLGRSADNDPGLTGVMEPGTPAVCLVGKSWDYQCEVALGVTLEENLELIRDSIAYLKEQGREPMFDAEHFFDGYKANPDYALECLKTAYEAGARWVVLCDTNGGSMPEEVFDIVTAATKVVPGDHLGMHAHNDTEQAVANSLAAIRAGARQVQGTLNGLGERCGNANMCALIPTLMLKQPYADQFDVNVAAEDLPKLTHVSRQLDEILNRAANPHQAYVGANAFAHKGGLHVSAVQKNPQTYEHVRPEAVGNSRRILVSAQAGRSNIVSRLESVNIDIPGDHPKINRLLEKVKRWESEGLSFDGADASFELMARRELGMLPKYFDVESFKVLVERRHNVRGELVTLSEAIVKVTVDGKRYMSVAEGQGPVNAIDQALRKDLGRYSAHLTGLELLDFKVRLINSKGTDAVTRVLIESGDEKGNRWNTIGVSSNIVDASFQALEDSIIYKLWLDKAAPQGETNPTGQG